MDFFRVHRGDASERDLPTNHDSAVSGRSLRSTLAVYSGALNLRWYQLDTSIFATGTSQLLKAQQPHCGDRDGGIGVGICDP